MIAVGLNLLFYVLYVCFHSVEGVYDQTIDYIVADYLKHLELIFNKNLSFITPHLLVVLALIFNVFVVVSVLPSIVKFGNWYGKTLK